MERLLLEKLRYAAAGNLLLFFLSRRQELGVTVVRMTALEMVNQVSGVERLCFKSSITDAEQSLQIAVLLSVSDSLKNIHTADILFSSATVPAQT